MYYVSYYNLLVAHGPRPYVLVMANILSVPISRNAHQQNGESV